jgi:hypothetical protein
MKKSASALILLFVMGTVFLTGYTNCSSGFSGNTGTTTGVTNGSSTTVPTPGSNESNYMAVTVGCGYVNEPCVTITVCLPGTTECQTIPNVLLDTGSYGLRLFSNVSLDNFNTTTALQTLPLMADPNNSANVLSECVSYADGSSDWGPVAQADITMGGETAASVPIQIINSTFGTLPSDCTSPDTSPLTDGYNGILGVGLFTADCGSGCAPGTGAANNNIYFSCPSSGTGACSGTTVAISSQVTNPVSLLPVDNNGVILQLPSVPVSFGLSDGASSANGYLYFGIGTELDNIPSGTTTLAADQNGNFITTFNGSTSSSSFIDSGSNALYFPAPSNAPGCSDNSFYCPTSELTLSATQIGATRAASQTVSFNLGNADDEFSQSNPNNIFADLGGSLSSDFDWGLPFFFGRSVYVQIDGATSSLGTGPLWAY